MGTQQSFIPDAHRPRLSELGRRWHFPKQGRWLLSSALLLGLSVLFASPAHGADTWVNPGTMGPNALPSYPGDGPWTDARTQIRVAMAGQITHRYDYSAVPTFRVEAPFGSWVTLISEGSPVEFWSVSRQTIRDWNLDSDSGISKGDLRFGAKVLLFDGKSRWPSLALRQITKTTTGKNYRNRRFTNAPAYWLDGLVGHRLSLKSAGELELWAVLGFFAWQQGADGQNDALTWSATANYKPSFGGYLRTEVRGYVGWQKHSTPVVLSMAVEWPLTHYMGVWGATNFGILDAPTLDTHLGVSFYLPAAIPFFLGSSDDKE